LFAFGATIVGFTIICIGIYVVILVASTSFGSPSLPFLVPIFAALFSFIFTFLVVVPSCAIGEPLFVRRLQFPWFSHLLGEA